MPIEESKRRPVDGFEDDCRFCFGSGYTTKARVEKFEQNPLLTPTYSEMEAYSKMPQILCHVCEGHGYTLTAEGNRLLRFLEVRGLLK
jgi:hypothetical protein